MRDFAAASGSSSPKVKTRTKWSLARAAMLNNNEKVL